MKHAGMIVLLLALSLSPVICPANGLIQLYSDAAGTSCNILDNVPGILIVHMWLTGFDNAYIVEFRAPIPSCWVGASWIGDNIAAPTYIGNSQDIFGLTIRLIPLGIGCPESVDSPAYLGFLTFLTNGTAEECCSFPVLQAFGNYEFDGPAGMYCDGSQDVLVGLTGGVAVINPNYTCDCMGTIPTENTTWGRIKAHYNNQ